MTQDAIDLKTYITYLVDKDIKSVDALLRFNTVELDEYNSLLEHFTQTNSSSASTADKGKALEDIVSYVIDKSTVFEVYENVRTSSNEIDLLTRLNRRGRMFASDGFLSFDSNFLCECKNYNKKIDVTWVGKFYSLIKVTRNNIGILFSYHGLTGKGWNHATGLTKKIFLTDENNAKIIDFNIDDFNQLSKGISFIQIINDKIFSLQNDVSIDQLISTHPNEDPFLNTDK